jgi:hypothetical protein
MSYALRNTLIIAIFWALIMAGGGYYIYGVQKKKHARLLIENERKKGRVEELMGMHAMKGELIEQYAHLKEISMGKMGVLATNESPGETFDYVLRELKRTKSNLEVNLRYINSDFFPAFDRRSYKMSGLGKFSDFYRLVWFFEHGPIFYGVKAVAVERIKPESMSFPVPKGSEITFEVTLWSYDKKEGLDIENVIRETGKPVQLAELVNNKLGTAFDATQRKARSPGPARAQIPSPEPSSAQQATRAVAKKPVSDGLPRVSRSTEILAITPHSVIIRDQSGKMRKLRRGDRVSGGYVGDIDVNARKVVFTVSPQGGNKFLEISAKK